jgi:phosphatidylethanolamine/phosphatidyl-N-methylethanolamine N-methyltransferase
MGLFDRPAAREDEDPIGTSDAATRALSVAVVENHFVERVYEKLAHVYDLAFGPALHPGRVKAIRRMELQPGCQVLAVGVGTGINLSLYPSTCEITGIDLSAPMLEKAWERTARWNLSNVRLLQMDAAGLEFPAHTFDVVYAPYVISVVPDPVAVAREMLRVCRPGGLILFLNHFRSPRRVLSWIERAISPLTVHVGFKADLDLPAFLAQASLTAETIERVNVPRLWSLVACRKPDGVAR